MPGAKKGADPLVADERYWLSYTSVLLWSLPAYLAEDSRAAKTGRVHTSDMDALFVFFSFPICGFSFPKYSAASLGLCSSSFTENLASQGLPHVHLMSAHAHQLLSP